MSYIVIREIISPIRLEMFQDPVSKSFELSVSRSTCITSFWFNLLALRIFIDILAHSFSIFRSTFLPILTWEKRQHTDLIKKVKDWIDLYFIFIIWPMYEESIGFFFVVVTICCENVLVCYGKETWKIVLRFSHLPMVYDGSRTMPLTISEVSLWSLN